MTLNKESRSQLASEHPTVRALVRLLPGIVASALALVYIVGSVNAAGSLGRDGISVTAVRLFSLEQLLVRGVSVLTQPELLLALGLMAGFGFAGARTIGNAATAFRQSTSGKGSGQISKRPTTAKNGLFLGVVGVVILVIGFRAPWRVSVTVVLVVGAWFLVSNLVRVHNPEQWARRRAIAISLVALFGYLVANYFVNIPQPLATIKSSTSLQPITGVLVTHTDGIWYVAGPYHQVISIPDADVHGVQLIYRTKETSPSLWTLLTSKLH